jgi:hypothetical protein
MQARHLRRLSPKRLQPHAKDRARANIGTARELWLSLPLLEWNARLQQVFYLPRTEERTTSQPTYGNGCPTIGALMTAHYYVGAVDL